MSGTRPMGAHVEIVEPFTEKGGDPAALPCIRPTRVRVNGTDVGLIVQDSLVIHPGSHEKAASVTFTLAVRSLEMKAE